MDGVSSWTFNPHPLGWVSPTGLGYNKVTVQGCFIYTRSSDVKQDDDVIERVYTACTWYTIHYYYPCPQVCCIIQELQVLLLSSIIHSSNIFKVIIKVFVGHREGIYGEGLQSVQALVKSFALNIPN